MRPLSPTSAEITYNKFSGNGVPEEQLFLFANAKFKFNLEENEIEFDTQDLKDRVIQLFTQQFPDATPDDFFRSQNALLDNLQEYVNYYLKETNDLKLNQSHIFKCVKPIDAQKIKKSPRGYYVHSPYRMSYKGDFNEHASLFVKALMISSIVKDQVKKMNKEQEQDFFFEELPAKISLLSDFDLGSVYIRDSSVVIDGKFFQVDDKLEDSEKVANFYKVNFDKSRVDFAAEGYTKSLIPFAVQGGNVVVDEEKKVILISDAIENHSKKQGFLFVDENGEVGEYSKKAFDKKRKEWAQKLGYELIVVDRTPNQDATLQDLYHLDVFMNVAGPYLIMPQEDIISKGIKRELISKYGAKNIIQLSEEERKALCANFISFENNIMMTSPDTPQSFIDKLTERGFNVIVPPIHLSIGDNAGLRCFTQIEPDDKVFYDALEELGSEVLPKEASKLEPSIYKGSVL